MTGSKRLSRASAVLASTLSSFAMGDLRSSFRPRQTSAAHHRPHAAGVEEQDHQDTVGDYGVGKPRTRSAVVEQAGQHDERLPHRGQHPTPATEERETEACQEQQDHGPEKIDREYDRPFEMPQRLFIVGMKQNLARLVGEVHYRAP